MFSELLKKLYQNAAVLEKELKMSVPIPNSFKL